MRINSDCTCDLCDIKKSKDYIREKYCKDVNSRIIYEDELFFIFPTVAPLFRHSLLIAPNKHIETMAELSVEELTQLNILLEKTKKELSSYGHVICYEHGARKETGGSCGIYHAHIHLTPIPTELSISQFFHKESKVNEYQNVIECYKSLDKVSHYLLACGTDGKIYSADIPQHTLEFYASQFFRREIAEYYQLEKPWDWRSEEYQKRDENLIATIKEIQIV